MSTTLPQLTQIGLKAFIVDLDGVVTHTASVHSTAWKTLFDDYMRSLQERDGKPFSEFTEDDYVTFVDGKPRYEGVDSFLRSRGIELPWGTPEDSAGLETVCGLGNRKNDLFVQVIRTNGAEVFPATVKLLEHLRGKGMKTAVVTSSKNCGLVLETTKLGHLFDARVDGIYAAEHKIPGKPKGDTYVRGAELLGVSPEDAAIVEDAVVGVQAGRDGGFKLVIGVDRGAGRQNLLDNGADVVVDDLGEFELD